MGWIQQGLAAIFTVVYLGYAVALVGGSLYGFVVGLVPMYRWATRRRVRDSDEPITIAVPDLRPKNYRVVGRNLVLHRGGR